MAPCWDASPGNEIKRLNEMASPSLASFFFSTHAKKFFVSIQPPVGELMRPVFLTENEFKKEQGESPAAPSGASCGYLEGMIVVSRCICSKTILNKISKKKKKA